MTLPELVCPENDNGWKFGEGTDIFRARLRGKHAALFRRWAHGILRVISDDGTAVVVDGDVVKVIGARGCAFVFPNMIDVRRP